MKDNFAYVWCNECSDNFPVRKKLREDLEECGNTFYCPKGHSLTYLRKDMVKRLRLAESLSASRSYKISKMYKRIASFKGTQTKQRNRLFHGACPYCKQVPKDVVKHIQEKHNPKDKK